MNTLAQFEAIASRQDYFQELELQRIKPATIAKYRQCIQSFLDFLGDNPPSEHDAKVFLAHLHHRGFKESTVQLYYHALKPFLLTFGINFKAKFRKRSIPSIYHTDNEIKEVLAAIEKRSDAWSGLRERDWLIVALLAYTGIRRGELLSIKLSDINFATHLILVQGKGDDIRMVPISPDIYNRLKAYTATMAPRDRLFTIQARRVWQIVTNYACLAGVNNLHPHSFRHFVATQLVERGATVHDIQQLLGHANISTTQAYFDHRPSRLYETILLLPNLTEVADGQVPTEDSTGNS